MIESKSPVHSDPEIMSGMPVFQGTRVPFQALLDYLQGGDTIDEFLDDFPTVTRQQAIEAIRQAGQMLLAHALAQGAGSAVTARPSTTSASPLASALPLATR